MLWSGMTISIVIYFVITLFIQRRGDAPGNNVFSLILISVGMVMTLASLLIKQKLLSRSIEQRSEGLVQQAYVVAWALCETSALLGMLDFFVTANRFYYLPFLIALIGDVINFPRRQDVEAASSPKPKF
jgi:heme/copper-type cytochrome/quinol oxidase subunit 1